MRSIILGLCAAFFFATTFVLNRGMEMSGGSWIWSASLRFMFMVPFLLVIVMRRKKLKQLFDVMKESPGTWLLWSIVGFGLFYGPICFATVYSPGWLVAGTWQFTIIAGSLLAPFFVETVQSANGPILMRGKIPAKGLLFSLIILVGIGLMQWEQAEQLSLKELWLGIFPVVVAAFAYPLGNRKMMSFVNGRLDVFQRVLGMTLASMPLWILLSIYGLMTVGPPSMNQTVQSLIVAISSGVIATVLFFMATDMVKDSMQKLASVEATQSMEVLFALAGEMVFLSIAFPSLLSWTGIFLVIVGMILHSYASRGDIKLISKEKVSQM
ncbi:DMT family transporter [Robertmurraya kyonggiensis]|uniref:Multidrug resistance efflux transporter family protein n=1 Tax=Robertmurraya kyonggiensis TaxID=1037680 RepID=A0A4U1D3B8_9BACI|nr:multidrug resistance efflux transporter family protein [Robertmurraya kyonggiensis]TKC16288.1 multidrug resistance efflux transporter family protein [Robertmurraya kyonggiensis]